MHRLFCSLTLLVLLVLGPGCGRSAKNQDSAPSIVEDQAADEKALPEARTARKLMRKKNWNEAMRELKRVTSLHKDKAPLWNDLGICEMKLESWEDAESSFQRALQLDAKYFKAHYNLGLLFSKQSQRTNAIAHYEAALKLNGNFHEARYNLGTVYLQDGQIENAEAAFRTLITSTRSARFHKAYYNLAMALAERGDHQAAVKYFQEALLLNSSYVSAYINLANSQMALQEYGAAEENLQKALRLEPDNSKAYWNLALLTKKTKGEEAAAPLFEKAVSANPEHATVIFNAGLAAYQAKDWRKAEDLFRKAADAKSDYAEAFYMLGKTYSEQDDLMQAIKAYETACSLKKGKYTSAEYNLGLAFLTTKDPTNALPHFQAAVESAPKHFEAWKHLGYAYAREHDYTNAVTAMVKAFTLRPTNDAVLLSAVHYLQKLHRTNEIEPLYEQAVEAGTGVADALRSVGRKAAKSGQDEKAIELYRKALSIEPTPETWFNVGLACRRQKNWTNALAAYEEAIKLDPKHEKAWANSGYIYIQLRRYDEAQQAFKRALEIKPDYKQALQGMKNLKAAPRSASSNLGTVANP